MSITREFRELEIHLPRSSTYDSRHTLYRKVKRAGGNPGALSGYQERRYVVVPVLGNWDLVDSLLALKPITVILRGIHNGLSEKLSPNPNGHIHAWTHVFHDIESLEDLDMGILEAIESVAIRNTKQEIAS